MIVPKIAKAIENIDEDLITATTTYLPEKEKSPVWLKLGAMAACLCIVSATVIFLIPKKEPTPPSVEPTLPITEATEPQNKAIIKYGDIDSSNFSSDTQLRHYTEEELFTREGLTAFRGTVINLENFMVDFGGDPWTNMYGCILTVQIEKVYKGDLVPGDTIRLRLNAPVPDDSEYIRPTANPNINVGSEGIFTPTIFHDEDFQIERNGNVLNLKDICDCDIGYYDLFYSKYYETFGVHLGVRYPDMGYTGLTNVISLNVVENYIIEMLEKYNSESEEITTNE